MEEVLYTPEELSLKLKLSKYTIYEMIKRGEIESHRIGRSLRISEDQLQDYLVKTRAKENVFDGHIEYEKGIQYGVIRDVKIAVNTELDGKVRLYIKPEDIILSRGTFVSSARNMHYGKVLDLMYDEKSAKLILDIGIPLVVLITRRSLDEMEIKTQDYLYAVFKTMSVKVTKI